MKHFCIQTNKLLFKLFLLVVFSCNTPTEFEHQYVLKDGELYFLNDLMVLQDIIALNDSLNQKEPFELGSQQWMNRRLTELSISWNNLTILPESIGNLTNLERLNLQYNQISSLPETLCNLPSSCNIDLSGNNLCEEYHYDCIELWGDQELSNCEGFVEIGETYYFESDIAVLQDIIELNESLTEIGPLSIGYLSWTNGRLTSLHLANKNLTILPESIGNLNYLTSLFLSDNQLTTVPENIGNLINLEGLYLQDNQLTTVPGSIGNFMSLEWLNLHSNQIDSLPMSLCNLPSNCEISVSNNLLCEEYHFDCIDIWGSQDCQ